jgi:putative DNA primase/helicase
MTVDSMTGSPTSGCATDAPEIDPELYDDLQPFLFLWPTDDDCLASAQEAQIRCYRYEIAANRRSMFDRQLVVAHPETEEGLRYARGVAQLAMKNGAVSVWTWAVSGFGTRFATMREWVQHFSLVNALAMERAGKWGGFVGFVSETPPSEPKFEGEPRPIVGDLLPVSPLEPEMIPEPFRAWCLDISDRVWCPLEYLAAALIVILSGLIGRRIAIRPKRHDDWTVIPNLWGAIVGPPGSLKTPAVEEVCRPLKKLAEGAIERHKQELGDFERQSLVGLAKRSAAKRNLETAARKGAENGTLDALAREATDGAGAAPPVARRYLVNDATVEKLGELLAQEVNANGLIVFRDELIGLFRSLDRPGHEGDRTFFLEAWNGSGSFTFDRIARGTVHIPRVCLAMFGSIQPGPLASYIRETFSGEECDGFQQRFQVMMYPDPRVGFINVDRPPHPEARERAMAIFRALDGLDPEERGCLPEDDSGVPFLRFADDAQEFFVGWRVELERRLHSGRLPALTATHLSKYRSLFPSLALIFHLVETYDRPALEPVSLWAAEAAAAWCELLEEHVERIYQAATDGDPDVAIRLAGRLKDSLPRPFTHREVVRKQWSGLTTIEEVRRAVALLEDRNWVKIVEVPPTERGGRPTEKIWTHPAIGTADGGQS